MPWKRITQELYHSIRKANRRKLKTIEYEERRGEADSYFLWVQGLEVDRPWIKMEVIYSDFKDPVKFSIYEDEKPGCRKENQ